MAREKDYLSCKIVQEQKWEDSKNGDCAKLSGSYWLYRESNSVDSDRFHQETPPLIVQPRQVELKTITLYMYLYMFLVCTACNVSFLCNKEMYKQILFSWSWYDHTKPYVLTRYCSVSYIVLSTHVTQIAQINWILLGLLYCIKHSGDTDTIEWVYHFQWKLLKQYEILALGYVQIFP